MKKIFLLVLMSVVITNIFSSNDKFVISEQDIELTYMDQLTYEQSIYFSNNKDYSTGYEIYSETSGVKIYIDGKKYSGDNLIFNNIVPGTYYMQIKKSGYRSIKKWITVNEDKRLILRVQLAREFGYVNIVSNSSNTRVYIDDYLIDSSTPLPSGTYNIKVQGFGFKDEIRTIQIRDKIILNEEFNLEVANFILEDIKLEKKIYNINANQGFNQNSIEITVNGPKECSLIFKDDNGIIILDTKINLITWETIYKFDNNKLSNLTDGKYKLILSAGEYTKEIIFIVDSSLYIKNIQLHRGFSGLLFSPTAELNRHKTNQTSFSISSDINNSGISLPFSLQTTLSQYLQLNTSFDLKVLFDSKVSVLSLLGGLFYADNKGIFLWAININYKFSSLQSNNLSRLDNIFTLNTPITLKLNKLYISLTPEYSLILDNDNITGVGMGMHYDNQQIRLGISSRVQTNDFENFDILYGLEGYYLLKNSQSFVGMSVAIDENIDLNITLSLSTIF